MTSVCHFFLAENKYAVKNERSRSLVSAGMEPDCRMGSAARMVGILVAARRMEVVVRKMVAEG
jgi:hypothetical protein